MNFAELIALLTNDERYELEERAAIMEFDGGIPRRKAEEKAMYAFRTKVPLNANT